MIPKRMTRAEVKEYPLRSKDVAWILDCSPDDVIALARKGGLNARKKGRFWRFWAKDVKAWKKRGLRGG